MKSNYEPSLVAVGPGTVWMNAHPITADLSPSPACDYCRRVFASNTETSCAGCGASRTLIANITDQEIIHFYTDESNRPVVSRIVSR